MKQTDLKPLDMKPADMKQTSMKQTDMKQTCMKLASMKPTDMKPTDMKQADMKQTCRKQTDMKPIDMKPTGMKQPILLSSTSHQMELPFIPPELLEAKLFAELLPCELSLYRQAFGALRSVSRQWLSLQMLRYRRLGKLPQEGNRNVFVEDIFYTLVDAYDGMLEERAEREYIVSEGKFNKFS